MLTKIKFPFNIALEATAQINLPTKWYGPPKQNNNKDRTKGLIIEIQFPHSSAMTDMYPEQIQRGEGLMVYNKKRDFVHKIT